MLTGSTSSAGETKHIFHTREARMHASPRLCVYVRATATLVANSSDSLFPIKIIRSAWSLSPEGINEAAIQSLLFIYVFNC